MKFKALLFVCFLGLATAHASQKLFLFGGGARPSEAISEFLQLSGGAQSKILVVTWASQIPEDVFTSIAADLKAVGAQNISVSLRPPQNQSDKKIFLAQLAEATGIFFSGGDQNRAMLAFNDNDLRQAVEDKYKNGFVIAGTSAGTAMMSPIMMTGDSTPVGKGLGLLPNTILDTHFIKRNRIARLEKALLNFQDLIGVGVDEGAALLVIDNAHAQVVGPNQVVIINRQPRLTEEYLQPKERYNITLKKREDCKSIIGP